MELKFWKRVHHLQPKAIKSLRELGIALVRTKKIHKVAFCSFYRLHIFTLSIFIVVIPGARQPEQPRTVVLKLWKTGFSLDEGPMRDYQNPANKEFLEYIKRG